MEDLVTFKSLLVKKSSNGVVCQLLHEQKCLINVQKHGKVVILPMGAHVNALRQDHIGGLFKSRDFIPGDNEFY